MTAYSDFVQDFPRRCREILDAYQKPAERSGREVTLILAIASAAFVIPFERLNPSAHDHIAQDRNSECVTKLGQLLSQRFSSWAEGSWKEHAAIPGHKIRGRPVEEWLRRENLRPVTGDRNIGFVLMVLRNALAHGNIFTANKNSEIRELVFLSKRRDSKTRELLDEFNVLVASPGDLFAALRRWTDFLATELQLPEGPVQGPYYVDLSSILEVPELASQRGAGAFKPVKAAPA